MRAKAVHWTEGMLLLPHHFQAMAAHAEDCVVAATETLIPYAYGLREISLHEPSLRNYELRITRLTARLPDGTLISVPENAHLPTVNLQAEMTKNAELFVFLALPELVPGRPNASRRADDGDRRLLAVTEEWDDRNDATTTREIEIQRLNAKLLVTTSQDPPPGYDTLPIAKLRKTRVAEPVPEIDPNYVPPLLACDCWPQMQVDTLTSVRSDLGAFIKRYAAKLKSLGGWSEANQPEIRRLIMKLQIVNAGYAYFSQLISLKGLHPLQAYLELCRLVGQLSLFRADWQPPELPAYNHDDLGPIFRTVCEHLRGLLEVERERFERFEFIGVDQWLEIALDPKWLQPNRQLFVGVKSRLDPSSLQALFSVQYLNWKLGSSRTVLQIYKNGEPGVDLTLMTAVDPRLPPAGDMVYYRIEPRGYYWEQVLSNRILALYINPRYVSGSFVGGNRIDIVDPYGNIEQLTFYLFVAES